MKKFYYIISENRIAVFTVLARCKDGTVLAKDSSGKEAWLYEDAIEYLGKHPHKIVRAYETTSSHGLASYEYIHAGYIRNKRASSMCARPYFPYRRG